MTLLLEGKEKIKRIYGKYSYVVLPVLKFLLAVIVFRSINAQLNYVDALNSIFVVLLLSLISCIMPLNVMVIFGMVLIVGQCYGIGIDVAGFALVLILIMIIMYLRFAPQDALVLLLTPVAFRWGIPCAVPIGYGLLRGPSSAVSAGCGVILYYFMDLVGENANILKGTDKDEILNHLKFLIDGLLRNQLMLISVVAFVTVLLIVNLIRRISLNYSWQIAIVVGAVSYLVIMIAGGTLTFTGVSPVSMILGVVGAVLIGLVLQFFLYHMDYSRTEHLQYEDDEYFYFVKAVPKIVIAEKEVSVKNITEDKGVQPERAVNRAAAHTGAYKVNGPANRTGDATVSRVSDRTGDLTVNGPVNRTGDAAVNRVPDRTIDFTVNRAESRVADRTIDFTVERAEQPKDDYAESENVDIEKKLEESLRDL